MVVALGTTALLNAGAARITLEARYRTAICEGRWACISTTATSARSALQDATALDEERTKVTLAAD
jgi:hypothetical protein